MLSHGTAFISYLQEGQQIQEEFRDSVFWLNDQSFDDFFKSEFGTARWYDAAREKYFRWIDKDPSASISRLLDLARERWERHVAKKQPVTVARALIQPWAGKYFKDAINLSPDEKDQPDLPLDLCARQRWPWEGISRWGQALTVPAGRIELIVIQRELETAAQWRGLLGNAMDLLKVAGKLIVELPVHCIELGEANRWRLRSGQAAMLEHTENFWLAGLFLHRLTLIREEGLDADRNPCAISKASYFRVVFEKSEATSLERTTARMWLPDFGRNNHKVLDDSLLALAAELGTPIAAMPPSRSASTFEDGFSTPLSETVA